MPNNVVASSPEIIDEINRGLTALQKDGYEARVAETANSDDLSVTFTFGESEQTMKFKKSDARKKGVIAERIIDRLNI